MPPTMLMESLQGVRRKVKLLSLAYGVGVVLAAGVALGLGVVLLDYLLNLPAVPRVVVLAGAVVGLGYVLWRWVVAPLLSRLTLRDVAGRLEHAFPQFDDRLRSTVEFLQGEVPGSEVMKNRVVSEASELAGRIDLNRAIVMKPVAWSLSAGLGAIVLALALMLAVPAQYRSIAMSRLFSPFSGAAWPKKVQINLMNELPDRVPVGQRVDVRMSLARGDRESMRATVFYQYGEGAPIHRELMTRGEDGSYAASIDARSSSDGTIRIWMEAGDDRMALTPITVVPRLAITQVEAVVTPPPYAELEPTTVNLGASPAVMTAGADVELRVSFNKGIDPAHEAVLAPVREGAEAPQVRWEHDGRTLIGNWTAMESYRFHIQATDVDGFQNVGLEEYEVIVRPDQLPMVQIEVPGRNEDRTAEAFVPLQAVAEDDYGIRQLDLMVNLVRRGGETVDREENAPPDWVIPLVEEAKPASGVAWERIDGTGERRRFRTGYLWELSSLEDGALRPGDVLEFYLQVRDNFKLNGETHPPVNSGTLRIAIISQEELTNRLTDEMRAVAEQVNQVRNQQNRTREETGTLRQDTAGKPRMDEADELAAERLTNEQSRTAATTKQLSGRVAQLERRMEENRSEATELRDLARDVERQLGSAAENPMRNAAAQLAEARQQQADEGQSPEAQQETMEQRDEMLEDAQASQEEASDQLQRILDRMGNIGGLQQTIEQVRALLREQQEISQEMREIARENLGRRPEEMSEKDRKRMEELARRQEELGRRTEQALANMEETAEQMERSDPASAQAMRRAATTGQNQQVPPNMQRASQQARQNQQSQAQAAQRQAEIGLEMMLTQLRDAERRKLEELAKQLAELQEQLANLIRRQAGHNLDNLGMQGEGALARVGEEVVRELTEKAERSAPEGADQAVPTLPQLSTGQGQTERNTRSVAQSLEQVPNGSEPAVHLVRAAGRMERAMVSLREQKLPDAYEPSQVEALASLEEAKRRVDEQKEEVENQLEEQNQETIRQAYERIKKEQEEVNQETVRIESARDDSGNLRRPDAIALGQLPGRQGGLADEVEELSEALASLESVVYLWANKDIVSSMNDVKDDLGKPVTGVPTQTEQARVVEQLEAMIRNLAIKPQERRFEQRDGGGGGGGQCPPGTPPLPSEAELRLLKELQIAVNRSTKVLDGLPEKDEPKLAGLGERQGELRGLLNELLQNSSQGQISLGPEPDNRDQLPEEAGQEMVENQELDDFLLNEEPTEESVDRGIELIGDRMARSRQRLAINHDPGKTTQIIQDRILENLDDLIQLAQDQQAQASGQPREGQAQRRQRPRPGGMQPDNQQAQGQRPRPSGTEAAQESRLTEGGTPVADLSEDIRGTADDFMRVSPRMRDAVIEGSSEAVLEKYRRLVEDYYRGVSTRANER